MDGLNIKSLEFKLSEDEFKEMLAQKDKGIISFKATRNDNITKLGLMLSVLFSTQSKATKNPLKQSNITDYQNANNSALLCINLLKPEVDKFRNRKNRKKPPFKQKPPARVSEKEPVVNKKFESDNDEAEKLAKLMEE